MSFAAGRHVVAVVAHGDAARRVAIVAAEELDLHLAADFSKAVEISR